MNVNHILLTFTNYFPTIIGLAIALVGSVILLTPAYKLLGDEEKIITKVLGQIFFMGIVWLHFSDYHLF